MSLRYMHQLYEHCRLQDVCVLDVFAAQHLCISQAVVTLGRACATNVVKVVGKLVYLMLSQNGHWCMYVCRHGA